MSLKPYQREFISFAISHNVIRFGSFELKSGRISPYFFNAGLFSTGRALSSLGQFYAAALEDAGAPSLIPHPSQKNTETTLEYNMLFGPAYKGIPLVVATAIALVEKYNKDIPYAFNRKEVKDHGEGGNIVGAPLTGRVLIIDDVITAGTAIKESFTIIKAHNASLAGVIVAVNRQERGTNEKSAIEEIEQEFGISVKSIITFEQIIQYMTEEGGYDEYLEKMRNYQDTYGIRK
ncbi:hypothetical protein G9A89_005450 [Geosiphon pyriformis]|nr:hypothetical protein G9A89_005450 [Geosiphon pyriformis]